VAADGLQWAIGAGQTDPNLAASLNLPGIYAAQAGSSTIWISRRPTQRRVQIDKKKPQITVLHRLINPLNLCNL
jgi:hypothetical protein